jgi:hypothetical protein
MGPIGPCGPVGPLWPAIVIVQEDAGVVPKLKSAAIANDVPVIVTTPSKKFAPVFVALTRFPVTKL